MSSSRQTAVRNDLNSMGARDYYQLDCESEALINEGRPVALQADIGYRETRVVWIPI